jgi:hypothetical protein
MSTKLKSTPRTITLEELDKGIATTEAAGFELISVTRGTVAGQEMNVLTFSEHSEEVVGDVELFSAKAGATEEDINELFDKLSSQGYAFICYADVFIEGTAVPLIAARKSSEPPGANHLVLQGRMSTFGGPDDHGMTPTEDLALVEKQGQADDYPSDFFLSAAAARATGWGRRLNPDKFYIACRWDYSQTPKAFLRTALVTVQDPTNGRSAQARVVDWGPNVSTGRIADLSPGLARFLELHTDDIVNVVVPTPAGLTGSSVTVSPVSSDAPRWFDVPELNRFFGRFDFRSLANGTVKILGSWESANIVTVDVPLLKGIATDDGRFSGKVRCHRLIADALTGAFVEIAAKPRLRELVLFWSGGFFPRHIGRNPRRPLSPHSWGVAFDLNDEWNAWGSVGAAKGQKGSLVELAPVFEKWGFYWGRNFSKPDPMHFQYGRPV